VGSIHQVDLAHTFVSSKHHLKRILMYYYRYQRYFAAPVQTKPRTPHQPGLMGCSLA